MSGDGAHLGVSADRALKTILGGAPQPADHERMDAATMRAWILAAEPEHSRDSYEECARYAAKLVLEYLLADPVRVAIPTENVYEEDESGGLVYNSTGGLNLVTPGLYERMKADGIPLSDLGLSGFQWGWAVNAARRCVELPPVANPAILTIGPSEPKP